VSGVVSSLIDGSNPIFDVSHAILRIQLKSDLYRRHPTAAWDSDIAKYFTSAYRVSVDAKTWAELASYPYLSELLEKSYFVAVADRVDDDSKCPYSYTNFGPPVNYDPSSGRWVEVLPGTLFSLPYIQTLYSLPGSKRHQQTWSNDPDTLNAILIKCLYRNDIANLADAIRYALRLPGAPMLPPEFWIGGSGGGAKSSGDKGCARLGSWQADKDLPHAFVPGGQKCTGSNESLLAACCRKGAIQAFVVLDPKDASMKKLGLLPDTVLKSSKPTLIVVYLGFYKLSGVTLKSDTPKEIQSSVYDLIELSPEDRKYSRFREENHFKFTVAPLRADHFPGAQDVSLLNRLVVHRHDSRVLSTIVTTPPNSTKRSTLTNVLDPFYPGGVVRRSDILNNFVSNHGWERFTEHSAYGCDLKGELPLNYFVDHGCALEAVKQASVATFSRMLHLNVDQRNMIGFLCGPSHSKLSSVFRIHPMHHPIRTYDVCTLFYQFCMINVNGRDIPRLFDPADKTVLSLFGKALLGSIVLRTTGRVQPFYDWHVWRQNVPLSSSSDTFPPVTLPSECDMDSFLDFVTRSCTDRQGHPGPMTGWTSMQFASSIPTACRHSGSFIQFASSVLMHLPSTITELLVISGEVSSQSVLSTKASLATVSSCPRERARFCIKSLIDGGLSSSDREGTHFISRQVLLDLEELWDLPFGPPSIVRPGYGGGQGLRLLKRQHGSTGTPPTDTVLSCHFFSYMENRSSADELVMMGLERSVSGNDGIFVTFNGRRCTMEDAEHAACSALYSAVANTLPNRYCSAPSPGSPHCHPHQFFSGHRCLSDRYATLATIAEAAREKWLLRGTNGVLPSIFLFLDETNIKAALDGFPDLVGDGVVSDANSPVFREGTLANADYDESFQSPSRFDEGSFGSLSSSSPPLMDDEFESDSLFSGVPDDSIFSSSMLPSSKESVPFGFVPIKQVVCALTNNSEDEPEYSASIHFSDSAEQLKFRSRKTINKNLHDTDEDSEYVPCSSSDSFVSKKHLNPSRHKRRKKKRNPAVHKECATLSDGILPRDCPLSSGEMVVAVDALCELAPDNCFELTTLSPPSPAQQHEATSRNHASASLSRFAPTIVSGSSGSSVMDNLPATPWLAPITAVNQAILKNALSIDGRDSDIVSIIPKYSVDRKCLRSLLPERWLNESVVNNFFLAVAKRDEEQCRCIPLRKRNLFFSSHFTAKLMNVGHLSKPGEYEYANVRTWSGRLPIQDIFSVEKIFFPINHSENHWLCVVVNMEERRIEMYDSRVSSLQATSGVLESIFRYLQDEHLDKKKTPLPGLDEWMLISSPDGTPQQNNSYDCGVFTCMFALFLCEGIPLHYIPGLTSLYRERIALSIARGCVVQGFNLRP
jgi:hypothetical protein